jgi:hypothetical protein
VGGIRTSVDFVEFGPQIGNYSIGRVGSSRDWSLNVPTIGSENVRQATGDPDRIRINEWLADGISPDDFIELFNPDRLPVDLSRFTITDELPGAPRRHELSPLTFIAGNHFLALVADGAPERGANHLGFRLSLDQETLSVLDTEGQVIDTIVYFPQVAGVAEGRTTDGATATQYFNRPTPGWANGTGMPGDFNGDASVRVADIELLCTIVRAGVQPPAFDINRDTRVDHLDLDAFLRDVARTSHGDANLDGIFNSADLVAVFISGEYEDGISGNSTWSEGDWDCDGEFGTGDLVRAFQSGRYSALARPSTPMDPRAIAAAFAAPYSFEK